MPETPAEFYNRVAAVAAAAPNGRLTIPPEALESEIFPFEGELRTKEFAQPVMPEPARVGEPGGPACRRCANGETGAIWGNEHWLLSPVSSADNLPFVGFLEPRDHLDLDDLDEAMAAEFGRLAVSVQRAVAALDNVARVHVNIWGDGSSHLHVWVLARPLGQLQLRGSCLSDWLAVLPPVPAEQRAADERTVAQTVVGLVGGVALPG